MFIDEIQAMQERGEELRKLHSEATDEEFANLQRQLALLDAKCPRYDVHNVFSALNPKLVAGENSVAAKRNPQVHESRNRVPPQSYCEGLPYSSIRGQSGGGDQVQGNIGVA
jgi:hypothetical protein